MHVIIRVVFALNGRPVFFFYTPPFGNNIITPRFTDVQLFKSVIIKMYYMHKRARVIFRTVPVACVCVFDPT